MATPPQTLKDWLALHLPGSAAFTQTVAGVAARVRNGEPFLPAVRELLDELALRPDPSPALAREPEPTGDARLDAYLGALAEHVAQQRGVDRPAWSVGASRFLDTFWFVSDVKGFRAVALSASPAAFRRRGVFIGPGALDRC